MLSLLGLWQQELGGRLEVVPRHEHELLELQQLLDILQGQRVAGVCVGVGVSAVLRPWAHCRAPDAVREEAA